MIAVVVIVHSSQKDSTEVKEYLLEVVMKVRCGGMTRWIPKRLGESRIKLNINKYISEDSALYIPFT